MRRKRLITIMKRYT